MSDDVDKFIREDISDASTRDLREYRTALETMMASLGWRIFKELSNVQAEQRIEILNQPLSGELGPYVQEFHKGERNAYLAAPLLPDMHLEAIIAELEIRKQESGEEDDADGFDPDS